VAYTLQWDAHFRVMFVYTRTHIYIYICNNNNIYDTNVGSFSQLSTRTHSCNACSSMTRIKKNKNSMSISCWPHTSFYHTYIRIQIYNIQYIYVRTSKLFDVQPSLLTPYKTILSFFCFCFLLVFYLTTIVFILDVKSSINQQSYYAAKR